MASILSIRGYSKADGKEIFYIEPFWWKTKEFIAHPLVREVTDDGFQDYEATLSAEQLKQMHDHFKANLASDWYKTPGWQKLGLRIFAVLYWATGEGADEFSHFIAGSYEWGSGM